MRCAATAVRVWRIVRHMPLLDRPSISPDRGARYSLLKHVTAICANERLYTGLAVYAFISVRSGETSEQRLSRAVSAASFSNLRGQSKSQELGLYIYCYRRSDRLPCEPSIISRCGKLMHTFLQPTYPLYFPCVKLGNIRFNI